MFECKDIVKSLPLLTFFVISSAGVVAGDKSTDLTGKDFSADELVSALAIPVRGLGVDCSAQQQELEQLTRGIDSLPTTAEEVPALQPMKSASVTATFDINSDRLTPAAKQRLQVVASALESKELKNQCFQVAGHTCDLGDNGYNMELSMKRAAAVKEYLVSLGVDSNRLMTTGFGETSPMVPNAGEAERRKNRRVDLGALPPR